MSRQSQRLRKTRRKIIDAGTFLFETQGFDAATLEKILARAGVARRTFYKHFANKVELLVVCARDQGSEQVEQGANAVDALMRFHVALAEWFEARQKIAEEIIIAGIRLHNGQKDDPSRVANDFTRLMIRHAQSQRRIRQDHDADFLAGHLGGAFTLCVVQWSKQPEAGRLTDSTRKTLKLFLDGAAHRGAT